MVDLAEINLSTTVKSEFTAHERHLLTQLNLHRVALSLSTTKIDDAESHYLAIENIQALMSLEANTKSLNLFDRSLLYTGKPAVKGHECVSEMLLSRKALGRGYRSCTKLCTLTPGCMFSRKIILREIQRSQARVATCEIECLRNDRKRKVDQQWFPSNKSKEYLRLAHLMNARASNQEETKIDIRQVTVPDHHPQ